MVRVTAWLSSMAAIVAVVVLHAAPGDAQQSPFLSLSDAAHQVGVMEACNIAWDLRIDEEQTNTDPGGNLDLTPLRARLRLLPQQTGASSGTIAAGSEIEEWREACGTLLIGSTDIKDRSVTSVFFDVIEATDWGGVKDIVTKEYNIVSAGKVPDAELPLRMQKAIDIDVAKMVPQLQSQLAAHGVSITDLRILAHKPAILVGSPSGGFPPVVAHVVSDLRLLFPNL